jgi:phosphoglycerate dehydrogenase-like enzyme
MKMEKTFTIVTTCPISERHQAAIRKAAPHSRLRVFPAIEEAKTALSEAEVLVTYGEDLTPALIQSCTKLKWIQVISAGLEKMPFASIAEREIIVTNARGIHRIPMAEYVMGMILQIVRRFPQFYDLQQKSQWDRSVRIEEANGKTLGLLGVGAIGSAIAEKAKVFGMRVIGMNTSGKPVPYVDETVSRDGMDRILAESDFVAVIVPLTPGTHNMIGERELNLMKKTAWLINVARGEVIDSLALVRALAEERIGGAVLDVFPEEPLPSDHPFWTAKNCLLTPHVSARSPKYMERAMEIFLENLKAFQNDGAGFVNLIDPAKGY